MEEFSLRWLARLLIVVIVLTVPLNHYRGGSWNDWPWQFEPVSRAVYFLALTAFLWLFAMTVVL